MTLRSTFAGIGKAAARKLSDGHRQLIHLTIAGADDAPIEEYSDLFQNLRTALRQFGDSDFPVQIELRELVVLVLRANVRLVADYQWDPVEAKIRSKLLDVFGFQRRALGQPALLSEIIAAIQNIEGVAYVDVDAFGGVPEKRAGDDRTRQLLTLDDISAAVQEIVSEPQDKTPAAKAVSSKRVKVNVADFENSFPRPAQLAVFTNAVPDTLILNQVK